jgi:site-specific recombinase XerD
MEKIRFEYEEDVKNEYLETLPTATANSNIFVLRPVSEFENAMQKSVYNFSYEETYELLAAKFRNTSLGSIAKNVSIIRKYVDFCLSKGLVSHNENRFDIFDRDMMEEFLSEGVMQYKYITRDELEVYKSRLENEQDKCMLELFYCGVRGRTQKGATLEELINLKIDPYSVAVKNNVLELVKNNGESRLITVSTETMALVLEAYHQEYYITNNGDDSSRVLELMINKFDNYVFRVPGKTRFQQFSSQTVNGRMLKIQRWCGNNFLTVFNLYMSGMIDKAVAIHKEFGSVSNEDYLRICGEHGYGGTDPERYMWKLKATVETVLKTLA